MEKKELLTLAERVLRIPTAPYHEHGVRVFVEDYCRGLGLAVERDKVGNVIVRYRRGAAIVPLVYVAHMDHPGFEVTARDRAEFLGGVPKECFSGSPVRIYSDGKIIKATVAGIDEKRWPRQKLVKLKAAIALRKGDFGMWDVPAFALRGDRLQATAIDDVLSVVCILATLTEISRKRLATHVWGVFTRAEEVGFHGAVEIARAGTIPRQALVISMEMSKQRPWAKMGDGPVIRVGDRMTIFDPAGVYYLQEVARESAIRAQRCLMDGGACEATAFNGLGYRACGMCLPLGNYHNIGPGKKIRAEYVSVADLQGLLELMVAASREWRRFGAIGKGLRRRVEDIRARAPRELKN